MKGLACGIGLALSTVPVLAHDDTSQAGTPVCLEANFMMADAMNAPFGAQGAGRVLEVNIITGARGITVNNPFNPGNVGGPVCADEDIACPAPFKPTGVLSGGMNGHAFITSAGQVALTEFHRDGTAIRSVSYKKLLGNPTEGGPWSSPNYPDGVGFASVPRPLGTQMMPNGNIIQAICDANFFNAFNSDQAPEGGLEANQYFPPVNQPADRAANSRLLVLDQETMEVIDEYSAPADSRWGCMAGIAFTSEGMLVSMFHGNAVFVIDWKAGIDNEMSEGVGSNRKDKNDDDSDDSVGTFSLGIPKNVAKVIRVIDFLPAGADEAHRRDSLRAITLDEAGNLYATNRSRSRPCFRGEIPGPGGCNPGVFRQRIDIVQAGDDAPSGTIGLDPGVNVIAGIRTNRMSAIGCDNIGGPTAGDTNPAGTSCDVETLLIASSAFNPGCTVSGAVPPAPCFVQGGGVGEYLIDADHLDGGSAAGDGSGQCTGDQTPGATTNGGCAQPIATFLGRANGNNVTADDFVDPRMLMTIHEAFIQ